MNTDTHRFKLFNRQGEAFDRGETFSGGDFATGLQAVEALRPQLPAGMVQLVYRQRIQLLLHHYW